MIDKILNEYEEYRTFAEISRKKRIEEVYEKFPRIKEIEDEIFRLGSENMINILNNPDESEKLNSEFKKKIKKLQDEKKTIIKENKIDKNYNKAVYRCNICSDTGYTEDGRKCVCFKQKLINEAYAKSNLGEMLEKQNFDNFSFEYYPEKLADTDVSPLENMKNIYNRAKSFCDNFEKETKSLLFYGSTGLGKTFLSSCIAKNLMDNGKIVIYSRAPKLFGMYEDYKFGRNPDKTLIDEIYNCDLLIIDDLGTESKNSMNISLILEIINERTSENKKTIINTNLDLSELTKQYSQRFTSRIIEYFITCKFTGKDIRIQMLTK